MNDLFREYSCSTRHDVMRTFFSLWYGLGSGAE